MATYFSPTRFAGGTSLGNLYVRLTVDPQQFLAGMNAAKGSVGSMTNTLAGLTAAALGSITAVAALAAVSVREYAKFDKAMTNSLSIMEGVNAGMRASMEETAKTLSTVTTKSAAELAEGYFFLASAGLSATQSMKALPIVAKLATAGNISMTDATNELVNAQAALGLTSDDATENMRQMARIADVLAKADMEATGTIEEFAAALTNKAAAAMRQWNIPLEEGVAVLAAFAQQGTRGRTAGEAFNQMTRDLMTAGLKFSDVFQDMGVKVFDANNQLRYLPDILQDMEKAFAGASDGTKRAELKLMGFQDKSVKAIMAIMGMSEQIRKYDEQLKKAAGTLETIYLKQMQSFSAIMTTAWHEIQLVLIALGAQLAPTLIEVGAEVVSLIKAFGEWNTQTGAVLFVILSLVDAVRFLTMGFMTIYTVLKVVATVLVSMVVVNLELVQTAFQVTIKLVVILWNALKSLADAWIDTALAASGFGEAVWKAMTGDFAGAKAAAMAAVSGIKEGFVNAGTTMATAVTDAMKVIGDNASRSGELIGNELGGAFADIEEELDKLVGKYEKVFPSDEVRAKKTKDAVDTLKAALDKLGGAYTNAGNAAGKAGDKMISNADKVLNNQNMQALIRMIGAPNQEKPISGIGQGITGQGLFDSMNGLNKKSAEQALSDAGLSNTGDSMGGSMGMDQESAQAERIARQIKMEEEKIRVLGELQALQVDQDAKTQELLATNLEAHNERLKKLQWAQAQVLVDAWQGAFDALADAAKGLAGEQSKAYRAMFAVSKAFAIADSVIKIQQGIANALSLPFPANLAAVASVVASAANIISTINSVKLEFGGEKELGGPVSAGKTFLVGEAGPELFTPSSHGNIIPNDQLGGGRGGVKVVVNNYTDTRADVTEKQDGEGRTVEVMIRRMKQEISSEIRDGRGEINRSMEASFGLKRGKA